MTKLIASLVQRCGALRCARAEYICQTDEINDPFTVTIVQKVFQESQHVSPQIKEIKLVSPESTPCTQFRLRFSIQYAKGKENYNRIFLTQNMTVSFNHLPRTRYIAFNLL